MIAALSHAASLRLIAGGLGLAILCTVGLVAQILHGRAFRRARQLPKGPGS